MKVAGLSKARQTVRVSVQINNTFRKTLYKDQPSFNDTAAAGKQLAPHRIMHIGTHIFLCVWRNLRYQLQSPLMISFPMFARLLYCKEKKKKN